MEEGRGICKYSWIAVIFR